MFDRLIDFVLQFIEDLWPCNILQPNERGVRVLAGVDIEVLGPGLWWKLPLLQKITKTSVVRDAAFFQTQYITTKDGHSITVRAMCQWTVHNVKTYLLDTEDADGALGDSVIALIEDCLSGLTWDEIQTREWIRPLTTRVKRRAGEFGIKVHRLGFGTLARSLTIGVIQ
jgi:regulator of protease activity HflC (stomatin/prohibitin superfamily)